MTSKLDLALLIIDKQQQLIDNLQWKVEKYEKLMDELTGVSALHDIPLAGEEYHLAQQTARSYDD